MPTSLEAAESASTEVERLRKTIKRGGSKQVQAADERTIIKATCLAWFNSHRPVVRAAMDEELLEPVDVAYKAVFGAAERSTTRARYDSLLKGLRANLSEVASYLVAPPTTPAPTGDDAPNFSPLVPDPNMRLVLERRWTECFRCVQAGAPLAATVMMGGLLEALLLARVHRHPDKSAIVKSASAPIDRKTSKTLPLGEWTLRNYIDVAHELEWISASARDVGEVLRDYRNYIHPHKELSHGVVLREGDAGLFWEITKAMSRQVIASVRE